MKPHLFEKMSRMEEEHWWFAARREILLSVIRKKIRLPPDAKILDAGCGTGGNFKFLSRLGTVTGMDSDPIAIQLSEKRGMARVVKGALPEKLPFEAGSFDLITLLDVLEHLEQDEESLLALVRVLKPGGHLLITVPAFPFLWSPHDEANHHKRRYLLPGLRKKILKAGLDLRYLSYFNTWLFPLVVILRGLKVSVGGGERADDLWLPPWPLNRILKGIFGSERCLLGHFSLPFGVSIIACAQKPLDRD